MATRTINKKTKKTNKAVGEPQIIESKGGLTAAQLLREINSSLDEPLTLAALRDLKATVEMVVSEEVAAGRPVNLFGLVKIDRPSLAHCWRAHGQFRIRGTLSRPRSKKKYPAKVTFKATQGIFMMAVKQSVPTIKVMQKQIESQPKPKRRKKK